MVLLYNDKKAVDVPDCKMMKMWLSQNFLIGTAPRSLDKRHGQVRKCRRNLTSYCSAPDLAPYNTKCCEKVSPLYTWVDPCFKTEKLKNRKTEKFANPLETGVDPTHKRSIAAGICRKTEIVRATNSVLDRTEMNICELNELDSSVRSNAIGGFRLK